MLKDDEERTRRLELALLDTLGQVVGSDAYDELEVIAATGAVFAKVVALSSASDEFRSEIFRTTEKIMVECVQALAETDATFEDKNDANSE